MRIIALALAAASLLCGATIRKWSTRHNATVIDLSEGSAEIEFLSASTFRFQRCRKAAACVTRPGVSGLVPVKVRGTSRVVEFQTEYVVVAVSRADTAVYVTQAGGKPLFREVIGTAPLEWESRETESYWGLGIRAGANIDLRGGTHKSERPLLVSSIGYGLYFPVTGQYEFDLRDRARLTAAPVLDRLEYFFYYGPGPKAVFEEHATVVGAIEGVRPDDVAIVRAEPRYATIIEAADWREWIEKTSHASFSGVMVAAAKLAPELRRIAPWVPVLVAQQPELADPNVVETRRRYSTYLLTYLWESRDRGAPVFRHTGLQYAEDREALQRSGQFMIGDELLVAPGESAYLPRGIWTDLRTNVKHRGRQTVDARGEGTAVFARNGSIIPLVAGGRMELHYFPRLGAEFFIAEPERDQYTKAHAGPAVDVLRLEVEPVVTRDFEWVVHNVSAATDVASTGVALAPDAWRYDEVKRNLHVRIRALARSDAILNIRLKEPL